MNVGDLRPELVGLTSKTLDLLTARAKVNAEISALFGDAADSPLHLHKDRLILLQQKFAALVTIDVELASLERQRLLRDRERLAAT